MKAKLIGSSVNQMAIMAYEFNSEKASDKRMMIIGGVHGDEVEGVALCQFLLNRWSQKLNFETNTLLIPALNIDAVLLGQRKNANGVDLNRNLPSKDWTSEVANDRYNPGMSAGSEPENQALMKVIEDFKPSFIISMHSFSRFLLNVNGDCEPIASFISERTSYPIDVSMGYPTPGCLGTYTGLEKGIPTITYELNRGQDFSSLIELHALAIEAAIQDWEKQ